MQAPTSWTRSLNSRHRGNCDAVLRVSCEVDFLGVRLIQKQLHHLQIAWMVPTWWGCGEGEVGQQVCEAQGQHLVLSHITCVSLWPLRGLGFGCQASLTPTSLVLDLTGFGRVTPTQQPLIVHAPLVAQCHKVQQECFLHYFLC